MRETMTCNASGAPYLGWEGQALAAKMLGGLGGVGGLALFLGKYASFHTASRPPSGGVEIIRPFDKLTAGQLDKPTAGRLRMAYRPEVRTGWARKDVIILIILTMLQDSSGNSLVFKMIEDYPMIILQFLVAGLKYKDLNRSTAKDAKKGAADEMRKKPGTEGTQEKHCYCERSCERGATVPRGTQATNRGTQAIEGNGHEN